MAFGVPKLVGLPCSIGRLCPYCSSGRAFSKSMRRKSGKFMGTVTGARRARPIRDGDACRLAEGGYGGDDPWLRIADFRGTLARTMLAADFIAKWQTAELTERAAAQSHFSDLCDLLGQATPADADPEGHWYTFERGATKTTGGDGWADVWKRGHFGWEYKGKHKDLDAAYAPAAALPRALENPPLLVVCDLDRFEIHTNFTNTVSEIYEFGLDDLAEPRKPAIAQWAFADPEPLKPGTDAPGTHRAGGGASSPAGRAACATAAIEPQAVAHFLKRLIFCMFAEDVGLLPGKLFSRMLEQRDAHARRSSQTLAASLFAAMATGGRVGFERVDWFNGGLFDDDAALPLTRTTSRWSRVGGSATGPRSSRRSSARSSSAGSTPASAASSGAHYTDRDKIMLIVEPVIMAPLAEWAGGQGRDRGQLLREQAATATRGRRAQPRSARTRPLTLLQRLPRAAARTSACSTRPAARAISFTWRCWR